MAQLGAGALRPHRKRVQIVFQDPYRSLNPRRTVGAAITEGPVNFGMAESEAEARARNFMRLVGLDPDDMAVTPAGRPISLTDHGVAVKALLG